MSRAQDNPGKARRPSAAAGGQGGAGRGLVPTAPGQKIALPPPSVTGRKPSMEAGKAIHQPSLPGQEPRRPSAARVLATKEAVKMDKAGAAATAQKAQEAGKAVHQPALPGQEPRRASAAKVLATKEAVKMDKAEAAATAQKAQEPAKPKPQPSRDGRQGKQLNVGALPQPIPVVKRPDHEEVQVIVKKHEATGVSGATRTASCRYTKSGTETAVNLSNAQRTVSSATPFAEATPTKLAERSFAKSRLTTLGTRKMYHFQDPPLPKAVHIAVVLLLLAILTVALFLGYDVYHSFAHIPRRSNVTARSPVPMTTTLLPTPFFMR
ncbi:uncharacterized protein LOC142557684 isoform X5 [Dermacentor variabilis]|uniref:uncharacterized protein LOC142557684 isoform X5 n=1 Tax=Dermacentor variabilis TaxID=34621 RepID=UPI003F5AE4C1